MKSRTLSFSPRLFLFCYLCLSFSPFLSFSHFCFFCLPFFLSFSLSNFSFCPWTRPDSARSTRGPFCVQLVSQEMHGHDLRRGDSRELPLSRRRLQSRTPLSPNTKPSVKHTGCQIQAAAGQALDHPGLRSASTALSVMNASASSRGWGGHCYSPQASAGQNIEFLVLS